MDAFEPSKDRMIKFLSSRRDVGFFAMGTENNTASCTAVVTSRLQHPADILLSVCGCKAMP